MTTAPQIHGSDHDKLFDKLKHANPNLRRAAATSLSGHPDAGAALCAQLAQEDNPEVQSAILESLCANPTPDVIGLVAPLLKHQDPLRRRVAITVMATTPEHALPHIEGLLDDPDPDVRIMTLNLLQQMAAPQSVTWSMRAASNDDHTNVVGAALECLLALDCPPEFLPQLDAIEARFGHEPFVAFAIDMIRKENAA